MTVMTLRSVPDALDRQVKALAVADRRSVNAEVIVLLEEAVQARLDDLSPAQAQVIGLP